MPILLFCAYQLKFSLRIPEGSADSSHFSTDMRMFSPTKDSNCGVYRGITKSGCKCTMIIADINCFTLSSISRKHNVIVVIVVVTLHVNVWYIIVHVTLSLIRRLSLSLIRGRGGWRERIWQKHGNVFVTLSTIFPDSKLGAKPRVATMECTRSY